MQPDYVIGEHQAGENSPSSQCDPSPQCTAVDTGSEEPGEPRRSPAIGTGSGPGVSHFETSTEEEGPFPPETSMDGFLHSNFTSLEQEEVLLKSDIGVDDNGEATATKVQAGVREEFAYPTEKRQQQGTTAWATEQNKQFDWGRSY